MRTLTRTIQPRKTRKPSTLTVIEYGGGYQLAVTGQRGTTFYYRATREGAASLAALLLADGVVSIGRDALETLRSAA
ncbi:hypothetical protein [Dokdonella sp.]|uniref:hypothetical protein n=1 Tax=Dokdonella sp. TaxID=2291710 RepID=UPI0031C99BBE|nr:hypothetical protein [Dokdonella sp.]